MEYFNNLSSDELAKRQKAVEQANNERMLLCQKVMQDYDNGTRKKKKK